MADIRKCEWNPAASVPIFGQCGAEAMRCGLKGTRMERSDTLVIGTMNALQRGRALRDMHQALLLVSVAERIRARARATWNVAGQAIASMFGRNGTR